MYKVIDISCILLPLDRVVDFLVFEHIDTKERYLEISYDGMIEERKLYHWKDANSCVWLLYLLVKEYGGTLHANDDGTFSLSGPDEYGKLIDLYHFRFNPYELPPRWLELSPIPGKEPCHVQKVLRDALFHPLHRKPFHQLMQKKVFIHRIIRQWKQKARLQKLKRQFKKGMQHWTAPRALYMSAKYHLLKA